MAPTRPSRATEINKDQEESSPMTISDSQTARTTPQAESSTSGAATEPPRKTSRFQPKSAIRRSQYEREAQERLEAERRKARQVENARLAANQARAATKGAGWSRGGRGRGDFRGGMSGWRSERHGEVTATGFLGAGVASKKAPAADPDYDDDVEVTAENTISREEPVEDAVEAEGPDADAGKKTPRKKTSKTASTAAGQSSTTGATPRASGRKGGSGGGGGGGGNSTTASGKETQAKVKKEDGAEAVMFEDGDEEDVKININIDEMDLINLISEDELDAAGNPQRSLNPIRMARREQNERKVVSEKVASAQNISQEHKDSKTKESNLSETRTATGDATNKSKTAKGKEREKSRKSRSNKAQQTSDVDSSLVKQEDDMSLPINAADPTRNTADSSTRIDVDMLDDDDPTSLLPHKIKARKKYPPLFSKPLQQTAEDQLEWQRHESDMRAIAEELGDDTRYASTTKSGGASSSKDKSDIKSRRDGKVYLFQLPPVMPNLCTQAEADARAKAEKEKSEAEAAASHSANPPRKDKGKKAAREQANDSNDTHVKIEEENAEHLPPAPAPFQPALTAAATPTFRGPVGTLTVYESGATELDWGGIGFELDRGVGTLMQEVMLFDEETATATSMSQAVGSFIVKPNWDKLLEAEE